MSIYAYTGLPGSGKSYSVVEHQVLPALKAGRRVVTNVVLHFDKLRETFPNAELVEMPTEKVQADPATIYEYVTPGSVLILDEVWRLFPAGLKANHVPEPFRKLLAEHRHMVDVQGNSCQIVLVTQDLAQISAFARQLVETTFRTVKLTSVGMTKQYRVDVYNGPAVGPNPPENSRLRQIFGSYSSSVWQFYESHTMKADGSGPGKVNERSVDARANILRRPGLIIGAVLALGLIVYGINGLAGMSDRLSGKEPAAERDAKESVAKEAASPGAASSPKSSSASTSAPSSGKSFALDVPYRLAGVVINHADAALSRAIVTDGQRLFVIPYDKHCYSTPDGRNFCQFKGYEVSEFGLVRSPNRGA